jgi:drug/metabolite transporter (DMT)-like permease
MIASLRSDHSVIGGVVLMLLGIFLFSANDALGKWILTTYSVGQMLLIRSAAALLVLSPFIYREGLAAFKTAPRPGLQIVRVLLATSEVVMFFWAVNYLPLADTVTYYLAGPIYVTALSALILKEKVGWRRWTAVVVGFAGVLIALQPSGATMSWPALIALVGSICYAFLMVVTRYLRGTSDIVMASGQITTTLLFGAATASFGWVPPSLLDFTLMMVLGITAAIALVAVNRSLKLAPASVVVPYQYTLIVWAVIFGHFVFGDEPKAHTILGAAIIIGAGLYIFWREQYIGRTKEAVVNPP